MLFEKDSYRRTGTKMLIKSSFERNEKETYERTGLFLILKLFHYFGFQLLNDPSKENCINRTFAGVISILTFSSYAAATYFMSFMFIKSDGSWDLENAGLYLVMGLGYTSTLVNWAIGLTKAKEYSVLTRSLVSAIDAIPDQHQKRRIVQRTKKTIFLCCIPCMISGCLVEMINILNAQYYLKEISGQTNEYLTFYLVTSFVTNIFWFLTVGSFYLFTNAFLLTVCHIISLTLDIYLKQGMKSKKMVKDLWPLPKKWDVVQEEELHQKIVYHKKMSLVVEMANSAFAQFLLMTLAVEIITSTAFVKMITIKDGTFSFGACAGGFHILLLVLKTFACAKVNCDLKSSMMLKKLPDSNNFSNEQVSYLLYQNDQQIDRAEITYGNIFPVRKTFIFTIAGTALTYALVLQGV